MTTKITTNYHTHTYLCKHAVGTIEDYIKRAIDLGYEELGFSDHFPFPKILSDAIYSLRMSEEDYVKYYLPSLNENIIKYKSKIKIYKAVEIEYFDELLDYYPKLVSELDYLVLGQHYITYQGSYISVYSPLNLEHIKKYAEEIEIALGLGYFKILAHPDLFFWGYNKWDEHTISISKRIINAANKNNVILELNANGIRNCEKKGKYNVIKNNDSAAVIHDYAYPKIEFFKLAKSMNAKIMINDDAHDPLYIHDDATIKAYKMAEELNLNIKKYLFKG